MQIVGRIQFLWPQVWGPPFLTGCQVGTAFSFWCLLHSSMFAHLNLQNSLLLRNLGIRLGHQDNLPFLKSTVPCNITQSQEFQDFVNVVADNLGGFSSFQKLCNKVPKDIYSLTIHQVRSSNLRCWQDWFLWEGSEEEPVPRLSLIFWCWWKSSVSLGLWLNNSNLPLSSNGHLPSVCLCLHMVISFLYVSTSVSCLLFL